MMLYEGKKHGRSWNLVSNGRFVEAVAVTKDAKDSTFGSFIYFRRWVIFQGNYEELTDHGKLIFDLTDSLHNAEAVQKELERMKKEDVSEA